MPVVIPMSSWVHQAGEPARWTFRGALVSFAALAISLPQAWISLSKVALFLGGLALLSFALTKGPRSDDVRLPHFSWVILGSLALFAFSLFWTTASLEYSLQAYVKHAKLVTILLVLYLLRTPEEARRALRFLIGGQAFVVICSWLLVAGVNLPWVASNSVENVVFTQSYLDQAIMLSCTAAITCHLGGSLGISTFLRASFVAAAVTGVVLLLPGRTGHLIIAALTALTLLWALPPRYQWPTVAVLVCATALAAALAPTSAYEKIRAVTSQGVGQRTEASFQQSNAWRLNAWKLSAQATIASPWSGTGVGSWSPTVKKLYGPQAEEVFGADEASNPHQEFLLWSVSLGVSGAILLTTLFIWMAMAAFRFESPSRHAALSVLIATVIACSLNSALFDDLVGDYLCLTLGLLMAYGRNQIIALTPKVAA